MAQGNAGKVRVSIQNNQRSVLLTGSTIRASELQERLASMGMSARALGQLVVACGNVQDCGDGTFEEFGDGCKHYSWGDASKHAVHRLSAVLRDYGIEPDLTDALGPRGFASGGEQFGRFSFGANLS